MEGLGAGFDCSYLQKCSAETAFILPTDVTRDGADWKCSQCGDLTDPGDLNRRETEIATAMQGRPQSNITPDLTMLTARTGQL